MTFNELLELGKETEPKPTAESGVRPPLRQIASRHEAEQKPKATPGAARGGVPKPRSDDATIPSMVERLRKAVKEIGKEAATHRFTQEEKEQLADIVYSHSRQGYRTSENQLARIGVNWLIEDYRMNGKESVVRKVLNALKA